MDELSVKCLLYVDDQVILAPSACGLQEMVNKMNDSVKKRHMKVNVGKTKEMVFETGVSTTECDLLIKVEMRPLRSVCAVHWKDRCRSSDIRKQCGLKQDVVTRVERGMLLSPSENGE
ncbi:hypothetical protein EVAR_26938_1 [Eumeta japonica]|uniref:Uncharacterized protein n=1 Tax=Eumeta variegata TaxID=151549 RepID=A0A4C1VRQ8_EUMVA|nr:hypothetical protein EVAR_26938_1 [Eumeta japonica]